MSADTSFRSKIRHRREIRRDRRRLTPELRQYLDRTVAGVWAETKDLGEAHRITQVVVERDAAEMGIDPATILLLVQLAVAIYQALKHLGVLAPSTELVSAIFEGDENGLAN